jgi:N-acetylmuramoyl-L-alanine amidase
VVLHYTGMVSGEAALARLCDPRARVSAHYLVMEDGHVVSLVPETGRAWHAGISAWQGREGLNDVSVGIEIVNPGHGWGYRWFPEAQIRSVVTLSRAILARHAIASDRVLAHSDIAPDRKLDPGERFPWARLAEHGIGIWPAAAQPAPPRPGEARQGLARIGYPVPLGDRALFLAIGAFQRRYRPHRVDGRLDAMTMGLIRAVADLVPRLRPA